MSSAVISGDFREGRRGAHFNPEKGRLYLFEKRSVLVLSCWPDLRAWKRTPKRGWRQLRPKIHLLSQADELAAQVLENASESETAEKTVRQAIEERELAAWNAWQARIPEVPRSIARSFPDRQWHLLSFMARCGKPAQELLQGNPALGFALASSWVFRKPAVSRPLRSARTLLGKKQHIILDWLQWPANKSTRGILAKIAPADVTVNGLLYLRDTLRDPAQEEAVKIMRHLPHLSRLSLRLLCDPTYASCISVPFLLEAEQTRDNRQVRTLLNDTQRMYMMLCETPIPQRLKSFNHLTRLHAELTAQLNRPLASCYQAIPDADYPPPPIPGTSRIVPITSFQQLADEGCTMNHCVLSRQFDVMAGDYIYRVDDGSQRATLQITKKFGFSHGWRIYELRGYQNAPPTASLVRLIEGWLEDANKRPPDCSWGDESLYVTYEPIPDPGFDDDELREDEDWNAALGDTLPIPVTAAFDNHFFQNDADDSEDDEELEF